MIFFRPIKRYLINPICLKKINIVSRGISTSVDSKIISSCSLGVFPLYSLLFLSQYFILLFSPFFKGKKNYHIPYILGWKKISHLSFILSLKFVLFIFFSPKIRDSFNIKAVDFFSCKKINAGLLYSTQLNSFSK